jgi:YcxB-like protein
VWRAYAHVWRHSLPLKVIQLSIFVIAYVTAQSWLQDTSTSGPSQAVFAALTGAGAVLLFAAYPQFRFKPEERTLRIRPAGISTTIGHRSGDIPWRDIARVTSTSGAVYLVGTTGDSFRVPDTAFVDRAQREEFVTLATRFAAAAREP